MLSGPAVFLELYCIVPVSIRGIQTVFVQVRNIKWKAFPLDLETFYSSRSEGESQDYILYFYGRNQEMEGGGTRTHFKNPDTWIGCRPVLCVCSSSACLCMPMHFPLLIALAHVSFSSHLQEVRDRPGREFRVQVLMHGVCGAGRLFR